MRVDEREALEDVDVDALRRRQERALGLRLPAPISGLRDAERFLSQVGIALRYGPTAGLPLASCYRAFAGEDPDKKALARAIALTNQLLGEARAIEVHVIAGRVALVHRSLMPPLYVLVRRGRGPDDLGGVGVHARTAFTLLGQAREVTAGDVRRRLGLRADARNDPAYAALAELERVLLVDRGPFHAPGSGIPYLSRDGYPYHLFHEAHADLVAASARHSVEVAAEEFLEGYLNGAVFARIRKLASLFRAFLTAEEIDAALQRLSKKGRVAMTKIGREVVVRAGPKAGLSGPPRK